MDCNAYYDRTDYLAVCFSSSSEAFGHISKLSIGYVTPGMIHCDDSYLPSVEIEELLKFMTLPSLILLEGEGDSWMVDSIACLEICIIINICI